MLSRSLSTFEIGGTTKVPITPSTIKKMISSTKKVALGTRKLRLRLATGSQDYSVHVTHICGLLSAIGAAKTNSAMKARLMK